MANSDKLFRLSVFSATGILFDKKILGLETCIANGYVTILSNHVPLISYIKEKLTYIIYDDQNKEPCLIQSGLLSVKNGIVKIFSNTFAFAKDLNIKILEEKKKRISQEKEIGRLDRENAKILSLIEYQLYEMKHLDSLHVSIKKK